MPQFIKYFYSGVSPLLVFIVSHLVSGLLCAKHICQAIRLPWPVPAQE